MQVSGGGGGDSIKVNAEEALRAAQGFETEAKAIEDAKGKADSLPGTLSGWEGDAASKAKDTLLLVSNCMAELESGVMAHASLVTSAVQTFSASDDAAAAAMQP